MKAYRVIKQKQRIYYSTGHLKPFGYIDLFLRPMGTRVYCDYIAHQQLYIGKPLFKVGSLRSL